MSNNENSLMKKTKKELIEIILRKDDVEKTLKKEIDLLNTNASKCINESSKLKSDNLTYIKQLSAYKNEINNLKTQRNFISTYGAVISIALIISVLFICFF